MGQETKPGSNALITLREITKETLHSILKLEVAEYQKGFVAPNAVSIAQAHFEPENAWFRAIYADETPVGFVMVDDDPENEEYGLWRFMIDHRYQGAGFGRRALLTVIEHIKSRPGAKEFFTSCVPGEGSPCPFYEKMGFVYTGEIDDGELVMKLTL
jgi:diamine N-acetyltransferase